jgi:predicted Rossmann fold nucleotide-binding protein DprA/Smf involved in DNA uptake
MTLETIATHVDLADLDRELSRLLRVPVAGVTGTRPPPGGFSTSEMDCMQDFVDRLPPGTVPASGGCLGVDGIVTRMAGARNLRTLAFLAYDTRQTDWSALEDAGTDIIRTGVGLLARNRIIVSKSETVDAFGLYLPHSQIRSGTWACARFAQSVNKLARITVFRPNGIVDRPVVQEPGRIFCLCSYRPCHCGRSPIQ